MSVDERIEMLVCVEQLNSCSIMVLSQCRCVIERQQQST